MRGWGRGGRGEGGHGETFALTQRTVRVSLVIFISSMKLKGDTNKRVHEYSMKLQSPLVNVMEFCTLAFLTRVSGVRRRINKRAPKIQCCCLHLKNSCLQVTD